MCKQLSGKIKPGAMVLSLTKGMRVKRGGPQLISAMVQRYLGADCSVLMGANIAADAAREEVSRVAESTGDGARTACGAGSFCQAVRVRVLTDPVRSRLLAHLQLSEAVIGYSNLANAKVWQKLFARPYFKVELLPDPVGAEMCGTLKNVVALAAGMVDGLGLGEMRY